MKTKSLAEIFKDNVFTLFNLLNLIIAVMLFAIGAYSNMLFIVIVILNTVIGIVQECKAKKMVDELSILNKPYVTVLRDNAEETVSPDDIELDDIVVLESGRQICNDAIVVSGAIEVDESLITGESDGIVKEQDDELLSGSFIISGKCYARVIHVGEDNYVNKLTNEVKSGKKVYSELLGSMRKVTRFTSFLIVPLGVLLFVEAFLLRGNNMNTAVLSSAAALLGMLPKGLVLLISVSLANGVIRMSKKKILIQNIYSLETLAHADVLCLDKTGTLTDGKMSVNRVVRFDANADDIVSSYLAASIDNNATIKALKKKFAPEPVYLPIRNIPFSSKRKWGAVSFKNMGTVFVGASERLMPEKKEALALLDDGYRVIAVGISDEIWEDGDKLPSDIRPVCVIALEDNIRKNVSETLDYFAREGVAVKVISGDHLKTVSLTAKKAGLSEWNHAIDMSAIDGDIDYDDICERYSVFARTTPKQKQELVLALKRHGHKVCMTGDGVNDLLALRTADCSIAVSEGSDASRQISEIVLLESDFTYLPQLVLEGRKVVNNVTRTAGVFFIKTIYSVLLSVYCLIKNIPFPFIPIQITLVDAAMEAWPSFLTILESDTRPIKGDFLKTSLRRATPFAIIVTVLIMLVDLLLPFSQAQIHLIMYLCLIFTTMAAVVKSCIPFNKLRVFICVTMFFGTFAGMFLLYYLKLA